MTHLQTQTGCDSVVTLNLTIHNSVNTDTAIITACDSAEWRVTATQQVGCIMIPYKQYMAVIVW